MQIDEIVDGVEGLGGVLTLRPRDGDGSPPISWGDVFFYYAPDGVVPASQPFATIVTKDYPDDRESRLDRPGAFRVNVAAGSARFQEWTGHAPGEVPSKQVDPATPDFVFAHPVYGQLGWLCVVNPGTDAEGVVRDLLRTAHDLARRRHERRHEVSSD
jgi:hypothetical protein